MLKKRKILLACVCLAIIGGALYTSNYVTKNNEKAVQATKFNQQQAQTKLKLEEETKAKEEAMAKVAATAKIVAEKTKADAAKTAATAKEKSQVKTEVKKEEYTKSSNQGSRKVVVIDPGHASVTSSVKEAQAPGSSIMKIKEPGGAQGIDTRTPEYVVNMAVAVKLESLLQAKGYTVKMTKTQNNQMLGNIARAEVGNKANADLVIRIHADSNNNSSVNGASMLVPADTKNTNGIYITSKNYGQIVFNKLINEVGMNNRGVVERSDMTGFNWSKVPVILVEMGFQSNVNEDKLLTTSAYQAKIARGLADGIDQALK